MCVHCLGLDNATELQPRCWKLSVLTLSRVERWAAGCWLLLLVLAAALSGEWVHHRSAGANHRPLLGCSGGHLYHDTHFHFNNEIKLDATDLVSKCMCAGGVGGDGGGALCAG